MRGNILFAVGVLTILTGVGLAFKFLLGPTLPLAPGPVITNNIPAAPTKAAATLLPLKGTVEVQEGGAAWRATASATSLAPGAQVRTGADGSAEVRYGDDVQVQLQADSRVAIERGGSRILRLRVHEGAVTADVKATEGRVVEFLGQGDDAKVVTTDGRVSVSADADGRLQAAVSRGSAEVSGHGETVRVGAGQQTAVLPGAAPSSPTAIPASLLLQVTWPVGGATAKRMQKIEGKTAPLAHLRVGNQRVVADANGRFVAIVALQEGENALHLIATDVTGRTQEANAPAWVLDTHAPANAVQTDPNMWQATDAPQ